MYDVKRLGSNELNKDRMTENQTKKLSYKIGKKVYKSIHKIIEKEFSKIKAEVRSDDALNIIINMMGDVSVNILSNFVEILVVKSKNEINYGELLNRILEILVIKINSYIEKEESKINREKMN